ncbi:MAG: Uma2 family endonuclease [Anaerolineae bacterium]|nr:Uma2 family endonuclease [Anaerolineae bacterium]
MPKSDFSPVHENQVLATGVAFEDYLERFSGLHCELVEGTVIQMSPASFRHNEVVQYLTLLLRTFFTFRPIGTVIPQPFTQRLPGIESYREPDLMVVLKSSSSTLHPTYLDGPADLCVEVVSPGTEDADRGQKFVEYEKGGVGEYWIIDHLRRDALLYRRGAEGFFERQMPAADGLYRTPLLPGFLLDTAVLWREPLPDPVAIVDAVRGFIGA